MKTTCFSSRQPITKHSFRQYRLLGKGGFGEVRLQSLDSNDKKLLCPGYHLQGWLTNITEYVYFMQICLVSLHWNFICATRWWKVLKYYT